MPRWICSALVSSAALPDTVDVGQVGRRRLHLFVFEHRVIKRRGKTADRGDFVMQAELEKTEHAETGRDTADEQAADHLVGQRHFEKIKEVIDTLRGQGPDDLTQLCFELGSHMLVLGKVAKTHSEAVKILKQLISSGAAFLKFKEFVKAQGGDLKVIDHPDLLPSVQFSEPYLSSHEGYITELNAKDVGLASVKLGAGRETKKSVINYGAGIILKKKIGDKVTKGELLANLYSDDPSSFSKAKQYMDLAYKFSKQKPQEKALIFKTMQ